MDTAKINTRAVMEELLRAIRKDPDVVPDGFRTAEGWGKEWGTSETQTRRLLNGGIAKKLIEVGMYRTKTRPVKHYRFTGSVKKKAP